MPDRKPALAALLLVAGLALPAGAQAQVRAQAQGPSASGAATPVFAAYPGVWATGFGEYDSMKIAFSNYGLPAAPPNFNVKADPGAGRNVPSAGHPSKKPAPKSGPRPTSKKGPAPKVGGMGMAPGQGPPRPRTGP